MKNKTDLRIETMKRVIAYEKKKLRVWYEVVFFVLIVLFVSETLIVIDLVAKLQERPEINFWWILQEDVATIWKLLFPVSLILWEELPIVRIVALIVIFGGLVGCLGYVLKKSANKKSKAKQIREFERKTR